VIAVALAPSIARADATELEKEAEAFATSGDFLNAAARYRAAFALDPRPELICNVGVAYVKAKEIPRAHLYLSRCLERGSALDAQFNEQVRAVMNAVEAQLRAGDFTPIDIVVEPKGATVSISTFAKDEAFVGSRVVWMPYGTYTITAELEGYEKATATVEAKSHATTASTITLVKSPEKLPDKPPPPPPKQSVEVVPAPSKLPAVIASALTLGAFVVSGLSLHYAHERADNASFALTQATFDRDREAVDGWNRLFVLTGALGVAGAGISGYLWYRAFHTETRIEVTPTTMSFVTRW
jgi:hypothetical protein